MAHGRLKVMWDQTVELYQLIANMMRDPKKQPPIEHWQIHPYRERRDYIRKPFDVRRLKALADNGRKQSGN